MEALVGIKDEKEHADTVKLIEEFERRRKTGELFHDDTEQLTFVYATQKEADF